MGDVGSTDKRRRDAWRIVRVLEWLVFVVALGGLLYVCLVPRAEERPGDIRNGRAVEALACPEMSVEFLSAERSDAKMRARVVVSNARDGGVAWITNFNGSPQITIEALENGEWVLQTVTECGVGATWIAIQPGMSLSVISEPFPNTVAPLRAVCYYRSPWNSHLLTQVSQEFLPK